jgi:2-oxoglutarate/2-oxoacid ferredoxin oxidoreductase subunit beta
MTETTTREPAELTPAPGYTKGDFESDQTIRWCPGCGDYSILAQMQRVMPEICKEAGIRREHIVFVSGIGCSSRFPYYMNTFGFHGIHGRAPAIATGLQLTRPDLQVWVVTGDGDGLSIGGNHLMHCLRRNIDVKILLFNNRIYGLTKGQYSPTSELGKKTKSSPMGTVEPPLNPLYVAMTSEATFVARAIDTDSKHLQEVLKRTAMHRGSAFVEIVQNCNVFNDGAFDSFADKAVKDEKTIVLEHGKPLVFGKERDKGVVLRAGAQGVELKIVQRGQVDEAELVVHDENQDLNLLARILARLNETDFPVPLGVFKAVSKPTYGDRLAGQIDDAVLHHGRGDFFEHLYAADTWRV